MTQTISKFFATESNFLLMAEQSSCGGRHGTGGNAVAPLYMDLA